MADADEEVITSTSAEAPQVEVDLSDETQDFRLLNHLSFLGDTASSSLPKRGEKDFEPNPTEFQADVLSASRQAMHNALSHPRVHHPKGRVVGFYAPDGFSPPPEYIESAKPKGEARGLNISPDACVYIVNPKGTFFKNMGQTDRWNRVWILPEEALYMIERGSLDIRWPVSLTGVTPGSADDGEDDGSLPMSLQAAYACFMGHGNLTLERYSVFTSLKRLGYSVLRAPGWNDSAKPEGSASNEEEKEKEKEKDAYAQLRYRGAGLAGILASISDWIHDPMSTANTAAGPVVGCGIHRSYAGSLDTIAPFRVVFHVYKPSTQLKKTALPTPDFRIAVVNTREQTTIPTLPQLGALLESTPIDPPSGEKMSRLMYMRLRHGYRNVVLAVVDQGVTSYLRIADAAFGKEKLFDIKHVPYANKGPRNFKPRRN
ncbi:tRNA-splicing endonuclease subunit Sen54 [Penicillium verhagenii]|nr:tRNA-splicing endonuclease subunit Sen54 [Penicillium verhagenii]